MLKRFASNAGANVLSGVITAVYQLGLTAIATRVWEGSAFSTWALALSVAAIAPLFGANLSSVVTRRVVAARHSDGGGAESDVVAAARRLAWQLAACALVALLIVGAWLSGNSTSVELEGASFLTLLAQLLATNIWIVLWQVRFGQYYADESNWRPAITLTLARTMALAGFWLTLKLSGNGLQSAGAGILVGTWLGLALSRALLSAPRRAEHPSRVGATANEYRQNLKVFSGFVIWSVGSLVIQYGIPPLFAVIAPTRFNAFYLASTLNLIAIGAVGAAMSALLAPLSRWHAAGNNTPMRRVILLAPIVCAGSCAIVMTAAWYALEPVLQALNTHAATAEQIHPFLALLGLQTIVRTAAMGYSVSMAAAASARQMSVPILIEILVTFAVAAPLGLWAGPIALLSGLVFAGFVSSVWTCWIGIKLSPSATVRVPHALAVFIASQSLACIGWWLVAGRAF